MIDAVSSCDKRTEMTGGRELDTVIAEYAQALGERDGVDFLIEVYTNNTLRADICKAIEQMAIVIAAADVIEDDSEFLQIADRVIMESLYDPMYVQRLKCFYLSNGEKVDLSKSGGAVSLERRLTRLGCVLEEYLILHEGE